MGDRKFTLIELHLDGDHQFGPRAIGEALPFGEKYDAADREAADAEQEPADATATDAAGEDDSGRSVVGPLLALALLVAAGVAVKKHRGGDEEPEYEAETEPDVVVN